MSDFSLIEARDQLPTLIDRALAGEGIVITRDGEPVVELTPVRRTVGPVSIADLDWLAAHRVETVNPAEDAGRLLRRIRDKDSR